MRFEQAQNPPWVVFREIETITGVIDGAKVKPCFTCGEARRFSAIDGMRLDEEGSPRKSSILRCDNCGVVYAGHRPLDSLLDGWNRPARGPR